MTRTKSRHTPRAWRPRSGTHAVLLAGKRATAVGPGRPPPPPRLTTLSITGPRALAALCTVTLAPLRRTTVTVCSRGCRPWRGMAAGKKRKALQTGLTMCRSAPPPTTENTRSALAAPPPPDAACGAHTHARPLLPFHTPCAPRRRPAAAAPRRRAGAARRRWHSGALGRKGGNTVAPAHTLPAWSRVEARVAATLATRGARARRGGRV